MIKLDAYSTPDGGIRVIIPLPVSPTGEPPTEMRLFHAGANDTTKGVYYFTAESAASILAEFKSRGVEKMADYNHASIPQQREDGTERVPSAEEGRAACWYHLELRGPNEAPELWAVGIKWTPDALKYVTNRDYRYTSNAFLFDRKTNAVTRYLNFGLVNDPAAKHLPALVAASDGTRPQPTEKPAMKLSDKAIAAIKKFADGDYADKAAMKAAFRACAAEAEMEPDGDIETAKKMSAVLGCASDDVAILTSIGSLRSGQAEILALTGKATLGEAVAVARAWQQNANSGAVAVADLAKLAAEKVLVDFDAVLAQAKGDMKLSPADLSPETEVAKYIATLRAEPVTGIVHLKAHVAILKPKVATAPTAHGSDAEEGVTEADVKLSAMFGTNPQHVALLRAGKPIPKAAPVKQ